MDVSKFQAATGVTRALAERWAPVLTETMHNYGIVTAAAQADFLAQLGTESGGFKRTVESLNYTPAGLMSTFPRSRITSEQCLALGRKADESTVPLERQRKIANLVYGNRYGNTRPNDGWTYRGRGLKQVTFLANYIACGAALGLDLVNHPELLEVDQHAANSAGWFWQSKNLGRFVESNDFVGMTKVINGGANGLDDRIARRKVARAALLA